MLAHTVYIIALLAVGASVGLFCGAWLSAQDFPKYPLAIAFLALLAFAPGRAEAECLSSYRAVWEAHPGSHATYRGSGRHKCFMAEGQSSRHEKRAAEFPLPRERPAKAPARTVEVVKPSIVNPAFERPELEQALIQYVAINYGTLAGLHWQQAWRAR